LGASPTVIGFLFASFGVTLLTVSLPMGAASDRIGRKPPLVGGLFALASASALFAYAQTLPWLFAARLVQGAADAITWVVGFALLADLYGPAERGRVMGMVMSGTGFGFMIGPSIGGWLYELGGARLPFLAVAAAAAVVAVAFIWIALPATHAAREQVPILTIIRIRSIAVIATAVVAASGSIAMLEPVLPLDLASRLGLGPARIGLVFGIGAVGSAMLHPVYGRLTDRFGGRRLTMAGLVLGACNLPLLSRSWSFESAVGLYLVQAATIALVVTPSLAYMAEATTAAGVESFGVSYGLYNLAWGVGLLCGPAIGGHLFETIGFPRLALAWVPLLLLVTVVLAKVKSSSVRPQPDIDLDHSLRS
jgi:MFS transporter, DHA1 family, solute carrier family 18 (vesicular amine transporter), member 1/2